MYTLNTILLTTLLQQKNKGIEDPDPKIREAAKFFAENDGSLKTSSRRLLSNITLGVIGRAPLRDLPLLDLYSLPEDNVPSLERFLEKYHYTEIKRLRIPIRGNVSHQKWQVLKKITSLKILHLDFAFDGDQKEKSIDNLLKNEELCRNIGSIELEHLEALSKEKIIEITLKFKKKLKHLDFSLCKDLNECEISKICQECPELSQLKIAYAKYKTRQEVIKFIENFSCAMH